jgi:hypothetical protein
VAGTTDGEISDVRLARARRQIALKVSHLYGALLARVVREVSQSLESNSTVSPADARDE